MTTLNATQAGAIVKLIRDHIGTDDDIVVFLDNEYALGGGGLVRVSESDGRDTATNRTWLVGRDGGVIEL